VIITAHRRRRRRRVPIPGAMGRPVQRSRVGRGAQRRSFVVCPFPSFVGRRRRAEIVVSATHRLRDGHPMFLRNIGDDRSRDTRVGLEAACVVPVFRRRRRRRVPIPKSKVLEQWVAQSNDLGRATRRARARLGNEATTTLRSLRDLRDVPPAAQGAAEGRADFPVAAGDGGGTSPSAEREGSWSHDPRVSRLNPSPVAPKLAAAAASARTWGDHNPSATSWPQGCATRRPRGGGRTRGLPRRRRRRGWHVPERGARGVVVA